MTIRSNMSEIPSDNYERIFGKKKKHSSGTFEWRDGSIKRRIRRKGNGTFNILPDGYAEKSFVTSDINGKPIEITSRSQERRLCKKHGVVRKEKGMNKDDRRNRYKDNYKIDTGGLEYGWSNDRRNG